MYNIDIPCLLIHRQSGDSSFSTSMNKRTRNMWNSASEMQHHVAQREGSNHPSLGNKICDCLLNNNDAKPNIGA